GHRWVALLGTGGWHFWAQVGGTSGHRWVHCWAQVGGTAEWHRWVHCWAQVGALLGTGGRSLRVALLGTDHQGTDHQCPDESVPIPALTTAGSRQYFPHDLTA
ncbi:unnamed protein product, partial [Staurois parvus]